MSKSILRDWVQALGLRHQGVILAAIRGCDTAPKLDASQALTRSLRECVLNPHCVEFKGAEPFIEWVLPQTLMIRFDEFRRNLDHYPHHYVMHMLHAIEVVGYCHPESDVRELWQSFYFKMCHGMHVNHEFPDQMHKRLNADEATFARRDDAAWKHFDDGQSQITHRSIEEATAEEIARHLT